MPGRISELGALDGATAALTDLIEVVDISNTTLAPTGTNLRMPLSEVIAFLRINNLVGLNQAGLAPNPGATSSSRFLRDDGTWALPPGSGGAAGHVSFVYNATTTAPPADTCIRMNATQLSATTIWVDKNDFDGLDVSVGLMKILAGYQLYIQDYDNAANWVKYTATANAVDSGTYITLAVAYHSGPGGVPTGTGNAGKIEVQPIAPGTVGVPPGGTTGQALTKNSSVDYAVGWTAVPAALNGLVAVWKGTQAQYDAIGTKDANTLYVIV